MKNTPNNNDIEHKHKKVTAHIEKLQAITDTAAQMNYKTRYTETVNSTNKYENTMMMVQRTETRLF
jgi:hypothetical protein